MATSYGCAPTRRTLTDTAAFPVDRSAAAAPSCGYHAGSSSTSTSPIVVLVVVLVVVLSTVVLVVELLVELLVVGLLDVVGTALVVLLVELLVVGLLDVVGTALVVLLVVLLVTGTVAPDVTARPLEQAVSINSAAATVPFIAG